MADVIKDLLTILNQVNSNSLCLPDSKSWQDQHDRINAVFQFVRDLAEDKKEND